MIIAILLMLLLFIGGTSCLVLGILNLVKEKRTIARSIIAIIEIIFGVLITMTYINTIIISILTKLTYLLIK